MKQVLIFLQSYLLGRTGSRIIGLLLLISLVWWAAPHVGLDNETWRLGIIVAILLLAVLLWGARQFILRRRGGRLKAELQEQNDSASRQLEIDELKEKMNEAVASLKASDLGVGYRGNAALYALPWFMVIGPSAAGKTTLLRNSGLQFPYAHGGDIDIKGFGGTRNCDWWFSNEAVLLDTAGRYTTEEDDREEWLAFLDLLRRHRRRTPVNGVLVALSLADLLTTDESGLERHVKIIRDRIDELTTKLGCIIPVYLVLTKCDLLHGFESFFADLGEHDRNQVWGAWLAGEGNATISPKNVAERLEELRQRLCELRLRKLSMQRGTREKAEIFDFPAQFQAAAERLAAFVDLLLARNPYQETPRFCGLYFTSATQEGTPLQRIVGNLRQAFGYAGESAPAREAARSFFIRRLFQDVVFPNSHAVSRNRRREIMQRWCKSAWVTGSLGLIAGCVMLLSTSLTSNTLLIEGGNEVVARLEKQLRAEEPSSEKTLTALRDAYGHYRKLLDYEKQLPWHLLLGIYHGDRQIAPLREILLQGLEQAFYGPVARALEFHLENQARHWEAGDEKVREKIREEYYRDLKGYLMLCRPERLQKPFAGPLTAQLWRELIARGALKKDPGEAALAGVDELADFYLTHLQQRRAEKGLEPWESRDEIVSRARTQLRTPPNAERLYAQIINRARLTIKERTLEDLVKGYDFGVLSSDYAIPGHFTERGWREFVRPEISRAVEAASRGDWVIGFYREPAPEQVVAEDRAQAAFADGADAAEGSINRPLAARLEKEVRSFYFAEYVQVWYEFLDSVRLAPFASLEDAAEKFLIIARSDGPVGELMRVVSHNINLGSRTGAVAAAEHALASGQGLLRDADPVAELDEPLRDLRKFADPAEKMTVSLLVNQYLLAVSSVQGELESLGAAVDVPRAASQFAANILNSGGAGSELYKSWVSTSSLLAGMEVRTRKVAGRLLMAPIQSAWKVIMAEARADIEREWRSTVVSAYREKLQGRFPFVADGEDAALADVSDFFRPADGVFWSFVHERLAPFINEGHGRWNEKTWQTLGPGFSRQLLAALARARTISESLFRRGSDEPDILFYLYPMPTRGMSEMSLESNGQSYRYRNEPQEWRKFRWPGDSEQVGARLAGITSRGTARAELTRDGIWGLFHLLAEARLTAESGTQYLSVWDLPAENGLPVVVQYRIRADRENNVFARGLFSGLHMPASIF